jgi:ABC-type polysaccharide transport system permease subunit
LASGIRQGGELLFTWPPLPELVLSYRSPIADGAGRLRRIWHITLPGIKSTIIVLLIIKVGRITGSSFERGYNMMNPLVMDVAKNLRYLFMT